MSAMRPRARHRLPRQASGGNYKTDRTVQSIGNTDKGTPGEAAINIGATCAQIGRACAGSAADSDNGRVTAREREAGPSGILIWSIDNARIALKCRRNIRNTILLINMQKTFYSPLI
jgi:hypothetical protein